MDVDKTLADLKGQHDKLTAAYQDAKTKGTRAQYAAARAALITFREKYGKVIKALDDVSVTGTTKVEV